MIPTEQPPDQGPCGLAFLARPSQMRQIAAISRGTIAPAQVVEVLRMQDTTLIDRMWGAAQLSDRQHRAASLLFTIFTLAGLNPKVTACMRTVADEREGEIPESAPGLRAKAITLEDGETYRDRYRRLMRGLVSKRAALLDGLMLDQHPGVAWLGTVQATLDGLADEWGYERC